MGTQGTGKDSKSLKQNRCKKLTGDHAMRVLAFALLLVGVGAVSASAAPVTTSSPVVHTNTQAGLVTDWSDQRRKPRRVQPSARVACTEFGCHPVPPGCVPVAGLDWRGYPLGYDRIVCRRR
jgi:hypothetical protein